MHKIVSDEEIWKAWRLFVNYWYETEWEDVSRKRVEELIGKYITVPIPKDIYIEEVGIKFYASVKEALKRTSSLENSVFDMYDNRLELGSTENEYCRICKTNKNLAGPISFFHIGANFNKDKYRILFVGKNSWFDMDGYDEYRDGGYIADARDVGLLSLNYIINKKAYWRNIGRIIEKLYPDLSPDERIENIAVTNMVKCNTTGQKNNSDDKTPKEIRDNCINGCGVIKKEIEIMKPKRIIFMTGKRKDGNDYDKYIKSNSFKFGYSECFDVKDYEIDEKNVGWFRFLFNNDRSDFLFILRVSHPRGKNEYNFVENIMDWIKLTAFVEESLSKSGT